MGRPMGGGGHVHDSATPSDGYTRARTRVRAGTQVGSGGQRDGCAKGQMRPRESRQRSFEGAWVLVMGSRLLALAA